MNKAARLAALGLSAALAGSCGGGAPSKASFIAKADAICKAEEAAIAKLDRSDRARYLRAGTAVLRREVADLRALKEPKEGRATLATWLAQLTDTADQADQAAKKAAGGDASGAETTFTNAGKLARASRETAATYGMKTCGTAGDVVSRSTIAPK